MNSTEYLIDLLNNSPFDKEIPSLIRTLNLESNINLQEDFSLLEGAWELKWSSSKVPFLNVNPILENLQILDPRNSVGLNLLRPKGYMSNVGATAILAKLKITSQIRTEVAFMKVGLLGPKIRNSRFSFLPKLAKPQLSWLDINYLDENLRICKGGKGTTFALTKRNDISLGELAFLFK